MEDVYILDQYDGITEVLYVDPVTNDVKVKYYSDIEQNLEHNKNLRDHSFGFSMKSEVRPLAEIDLVTIMKWKNEGVDIFNKHQAKEIRKKINENPQFKVAPTRPNRNIIISGSR